MSCGADCYIDPCCLNATVSKDVRQMGQVLLNGIKAAGKQVPQVVRKHLAGIHSGAGTEFFHIMADIRPVQGPAAPGWPLPL